MRRLHLEDREFVALKAVAFFDPMAKDIEEPAKLEIEKIRQQIMLAFEYQVTNKVNNQQLISLNNRLANLLLLLPPLMAIGRDLVEEAQLAKLFGLANVDELMAELLLPEDAETRSYSRLRTSVTSSIVQSNVTSPNPPATSPQILQIPGIVTAATANNSSSILSIPTYSSTSSFMLQIGCCSTLPLQQQQNSFGNLQNK
uniref:NR LBD domain-containing protein n=1 Tax=Meloidogyne javanica TaxID=6303 RepID=A0A915LXP8_MELJA